MPKYQNGNSSTFLFDYRWIEPLQDFELTDDEAKKANMTKLLAADICRQYPEPVIQTEKNGTTTVTTTVTGVPMENVKTISTGPMQRTASGTTITPPSDDVVDEDADFIVESDKNNLEAQAEKRARYAVAYNEGGPEIALSSEQYGKQLAEARGPAQGFNQVTTFDPNIPAPAVSSADTQEVVNSADEINEVNNAMKQNLAQKDGDLTKPKTIPKKTK